MIGGELLSPQQKVLDPCGGVCWSKCNTLDGGATPTSLPAAGESSSAVCVSHRCAAPGRRIEGFELVRGRVPHLASGLESAVGDSQVWSKCRLLITTGASRGRPRSDSGSIQLTVGTL